MGLAISGCWAKPSTDENIPPDLLIYRNGFEEPGDAFKLDFLATPAGDGINATLPKQAGILEGKGYRGNSAFYCRFRVDIKAGWAYPYFKFPSPVPLGDEPVYLSGYIKFLEQNPETSHLRGFTLNLRATGCDTWVNVTTVDVGNGWYYVYTEDLAKKHEAIKGKDAIGVWMVIWDVTPQETICILLDEFRLTRFPPLLEPSPKVYDEKKSLFEQIRQEWQTKINPPVDAPLQERISSQITQITAVLNDTQMSSGMRRSIFVGKMKVLGDDYWRYKVLEIGNNPGKF